MRYILLLIMGLMLAGCSPHIVAIQVTGAIENSMPVSEQDKERRLERFIGKYKAGDTISDELIGVVGSKKISVGKFDSFEPGLRKISCRILSVSPPYGQSFEELVREGFVAEFSSAGCLDEKSDIVITGKIQNIELSTFGSSVWRYELVLSSSNGKSVTVINEFPFEGSFVGKTACENAQSALIPAVQSTVAKALLSNEFVKLLD